MIDTKLAEIRRTAHRYNARNVLNSNQFRAIRLYRKKLSDYPTFKRAALSIGKTVQPVQILYVLISVSPSKLTISATNSTVNLL